jgi:adenylate cyclase class 2
MAKEIEAKARCADLDAARKRLTAAGAVLVQSGFERNVCFDTREGELYAADSLLRLRKYGNVVLTYKGPRADAPHAVKSRTEIEVEVDDFDGMSAILEALGFVRVWAYEKKREEWSLAGAKVCLDSLPKIGDYVEVEAASEAGVWALLDRLGIPRGDVTPKTYVEIFREFTGGKDSRLPDMVFEGKEGR